MREKKLRRNNNSGRDSAEESINPELPACCRKHAALGVNFPRLNIDSDDVNLRDPLHDVKSFYRHGYVVLPHAFTQQECEIMLKDLEKMIAVASELSGDAKKKQWTASDGPISGKVRMFKVFTKPATSDDKKKEKASPPPKAWLDAVDVFLVL